MLLAGMTAAFALVVGGVVPLVSTSTPSGGRVFYVLAYHYGYAFFDDRFVEVPAIEARQGEAVTLSVVPAQILGRDAFERFSERTLTRKIGGLEARDPRIREKIAEDLAHGNVEHIVGIAGHAVYLTTSVGPTLGGHPYREGPPRTLEEAVRSRDPAIRSVTFTAKRVGVFDVLCVDSGTDGAGTCGWGHKWMTARDGFVVRP